MQYHIGFVVEQALGHITHGETLKRIISQDESLSAHWIFPSWETQGLAALLPMYRSNWTVRAGLRTRRALSSLNSQVRLDALFFHTQVTAVLSPDWLKRIPSIVSLDATPRQYDTLGAAYQHEKGPDWLEGIKWRLNRQCFQAARQIVAWSAWARQGLIDEYGVPSEKIHVIPPGVDLDHWRSIEKLSSYGDPVKILFVGGDLERKGGLLLVEAFRCLQRERTAADQKSLPQLELHLVTRSGLAPEPGIFVHQGLQPNSQDLKRLFEQADIFCLPSLGDCLPMALSEAGAAGLPLISTKVAAIPEIVCDGTSGLLVPAGDLNSLVQALRTLAYNPSLRATMGRAALLTVRERYDAQRNAQALISLLKEVVQSSQANGELP